MRTLCDVCEGAAAILFCAADEAALCRACDDKVHMCNKLASRHVRVGLAQPSAVPRCDICENAPGKFLHISSLFSLLFEKAGNLSEKLIFQETLYVAFFYCEIDGSSLCLQCDMIVHVGGKRTHGRYLLLRQRVEFPGDKPSSVDGSEAKREMSSLRARDNQQNHGDGDGDGKMENNLIDLNARPQRMYGQAPTNQEQMDNLVENNHGSTSVVPDGYFKREPEK